MIKYFLKDFGREGEKVIIERSVYIKDCLPLHDHDFLEIFYIEKGSGYHVLNNMRTQVNEGDLIFLSYHSVHTLEAITEDFTWINLSFYPEFINKSLINEFNSSEIIKLSVFKNMFEDNTEQTGSSAVLVQRGKSETPPNETDCFASKINSSVSVAAPFFQPPLQYGVLVV